MTVVSSVGEITETDIPEVADFLARQVRADEAATNNPLPPVDRLKWLLLQNPAFSKDIPLGWRIRSETGCVVGAAICSPFRIGAGEFRATALMFSKFFVDLPYRGMGLGLLLRFVRLGDRFPLFVTSTNAVAGQLFARVGATKIDGLDHTMLAINRLGPLAEEFFHRRLKQPILARILSSPALIAGRSAGRRLNWPCRGELLPMKNAGDVAGLHLPSSCDALAVVRDRDYVDWRYFTGETDKQVYCFRLAGEADRLVVVNLLRSGYRRQIRVLNVLDIWPPATAVIAESLVMNLQRQYRDKFDALWLRSQPADVEESLRRGGMRQHNFPAPLGWYIDRDNRLPTHRWYLMPGESE
jgi:hypothetical protein